MLKYNRKLLLIEATSMLGCFVVSILSIVIYTLGALHMHAHILTGSTITTENTLCSKIHMSKEAAESQFGMCIACTLYSGRHTRLAEITLINWGNSSNKGGIMLMPRKVFSFHLI